MEPLTKEEIQAVIKALKNEHGLISDILNKIHFLPHNERVDYQSRISNLESAAIKLNYMLGLLK